MPVFPILSTPHCYNTNSGSVLKLAMEIRYTPPPNTPPKSLSVEIRSMMMKIFSNCTESYQIVPLDEMPFNYRGAKRAKY